MGCQGCQSCTGCGQGCQGCGQQKPKQDPFSKQKQQAANTVAQLLSLGNGSFS